jgi:hypothetical protein
VLQQAPLSNLNIYPFYKGFHPKKLINAANVKTFMYT